MAARPFSNPLIANNSIAVALALENNYCNCNTVGRNHHTKKGRTSLEGPPLESKQYAEQPKWSSLTNNFSKNSGRRNKSHTTKAEEFNAYSD